MEESPSNIGFVCSECSSDRKKEFQKFWNNREIPINSFVKKSFPNIVKGPSEIMWILVTENLGNGNYKGTLANDPFVLTHLVSGQIVEFNVSEILDFEG